MSAISASAGEALLAQFRTALPISVSSGASISEQQVKTAQDIFRKLKIEMTKYQLLPPFPQDQLSTIKQQLAVARESLELGSFLSILSRDAKGFERYVSQLKTYYFDLAHLLPASDKQAPLLGLYLLHLLAQNQISHFHTEVELMQHTSSTVFAASSSSSSTPSLISSPSTTGMLSSSYITFPIQLEQSLMEGCYTRVLALRASAPLPQFSGFFLDTLVSTVREKIADCAEVAYPSLSVQDTLKLFTLSSEAELKEFSTRRGWSIQGQTVKLDQKALNKDNETSAMKTIQQTLSYATELERIV